MDIMQETFEVFMSCSIDTSSSSPYKVSIKISVSNEGFRERLHNLGYKIYVCEGIDLISLSCFPTVELTNERFRTTDYNVYFKYPMSEMINDQGINMYVVHEEEAATIMKKAKKKLLSVLNEEYKLYTELLSKQENQSLIL
ncbi:hypothetical protein [Paenibacillus sp. FSL L8-0709]|uniref:hypothetical protein n=1 Tax=Paenibacillus sp. FSL L8-0709 TaxID=2975312 RepID=UPI0030FB1415